MRYFIFTLFILFFSSFGFLAHGQAINYTSEDITVNLSPANPGPNQNVNVSIVSYITNLDKANIVWRVDGVVKKSGRGEKNLSFQTKESAQTTIDISIQTAEGASLQKSVSVRPVAVDLIWQSDGFVPPFYKGKALFTHQNKVTFVAIPHITSGSGEIPAKNLVYKWKNNGSVIESASGYGKNTYTMTGSLISRDINVSVEVTSVSTNTVGVGKITLSPAEPSVILYKKDPLYGIQYQKALSNTVEIKGDKEIAVVGAPFFFGVTSPYMEDLLFDWRINNQPIDSDPSQTTRVFRPKEGTSGSSNISLQIEHSDKVLQSAKTSFSLKFGN